MHRAAAMIIHIGVSECVYYMPMPGMRFKRVRGSGAELCTRKITTLRTATMLLCHFENVFHIQIGWRLVGFALKIRTLIV